MAAKQTQHVVGNLFSVPIENAAGHAGERVAELLSRPGFTLEQIHSTGQSTPVGEWLEQQRAEWVVLLTGQATLRFASIAPENTEAILEMEPGDYVLIPARCRHRVDSTSPTEPSIWLACHFDEA